MLVVLRARWRAVARSEFQRNTLWFTGLTGAQRAAAMVQTILIARALGITEYGVYGLLFGTIGLVASTAGLQLGLAGTVFVARYKEREPVKAAAVISVVSRFGWGVAIVFIVIAVPISQTISTYLLGSPDYAIAVVLACVFVGASVVSGIQDGVVQGLELFKPLAILSVLSALLVLSVILPAAHWLGLSGVLIVILLGLLLKYFGLQCYVARARRTFGLPSRGAGVSLHSLVASFALPSMLISLGLGVVMWFGLFMLSRQSNGFDGVAIVNTGLQWRGPVLLLLSSIGAVALPLFSRMHAAGNQRETNDFRRKLTYFSLIITTAIVLALVVLSDFILALYGTEFSSGKLAFDIISLSMIPLAVAQMYMQQLVGAARMWHTLWLNLPYLLTTLIGICILVPDLHELGFACAILAGALVFAVHVLISSYIEGQRDAEARARTKPVGIRE
ncbi:oligosaccharide flippase family protein [Dokdonella sp.]|uniref:oligosaccharide flippase family protein n=1 Tax=Dokdonella sp. TaxID=2291710 RepID=UPI0031C41F74|nr:oligosaccharide flippase family protein [Dokdonella sp.]